MSGSALWTEDRQALGTWVKQQRIDKDMTQRQLAAETGMPDSAISRMEVGRRTINAQERHALALALGVEESEIPHVDPHRARPKKSENTSALVESLLEKEAQASVALDGETYSVGDVVDRQKEIEAIVDGLDDDVIAWIGKEYSKPDTDTAGVSEAVRNEFQHVLGYLRRRYDQVTDFNTRAVLRLIIDEIGTGRHRRPPNQGLWG